MNTRIRRAFTEDIDAIVGVHRASVTELCATSYNVEQIFAWTSKHSTDAGKQRWADKIQKEFVWVLEIEGMICGFAHFRLLSEPHPSGYLNALYLAPSVAGHGYGKQILDTIENECLHRQISRVQTHATKNALSFYKRMGFKQTGEVYVVSMSGVGVESFPMEKELRANPTNSRDM